MSELDFAALAPFVRMFLEGLRTTALLSVLALLLSLPIGLWLSFVRIRSRFLLKLPVIAYVEVLRNVPLLVTIYFFFYALPGVGLTMGAFTSGLAALTLNSGAQLTEIFRGAHMAIPAGQYEGARALGLKNRHVDGSIILPQIFRIAYPALGNQVISLILGSSLVTVVGVNDLTHASYVVGALTFRYFEAFIVVGLVYLLLVQLISWLWRVAGRHLVKGMSS